MTAEEIIKAELQKTFKDFFDNYDHEVKGGGAPGVKYITSGSAERCVQDFKDYFDPFEFILERLYNSQEFADKVKELMEAERY